MHFIGNSNQVIGHHLPFFKLMGRRNGSFGFCSFLDDHKGTQKAALDHVNPHCKWGQNIGGRQGMVTNDHKQVSTHMQRLWEKQRKMFLSSCLHLVIPLSGPTGKKSQQNYNPKEVADWDCLSNRRVARTSSPLQPLSNSGQVRGYVSPLISVPDADGTPETWKTLDRSSLDLTEKFPPQGAPLSGWHSKALPPTGAGPRSLQLKSKQVTQEMNK